MKTYALEFLIVIIIIGLTVCLDVLYQVDHVKDNDRTKTNTGLERAHQMKHIIHEMHVMEDHHSMYVLTTGERKFVEPKGFSVQKVFGSDLSGVVAHTYDEGFGPKKWPEGARRVACGHVAIWKRIASECNGWCFVSEDDAKWPDVPLPMLPANGFVSYFRSAVCNAATVSYSADYLRVVKSVVRGRCMPYGAVAYAMSSSFAKTLLSELPMKKPVDHFLWEQSVKHQVAFVARDYYVKHVKGKSLRESVVNTESTSVKVVSPGPVKVSENLKPIHISNGNRKVKCDVPCYWPKISGGIIKSLTIDELGIQLIMSMEGEINHPSLRLSTKSSKRIFATTRFDSEIPMPYYDWPWTMYLHPKPTGLDIWSKNGIQTPHVPWESVSKAGVFIARNCKSKSGREKLVEELMTLLPVKSVSSCLNNLRLPPAELADKRKLMRQYAFYFAFENEITQDYISEKLWSTFGAGVLPVYFGAPNIKDHVPEHSIVNVADYDSRADLANHLKDILENKDLYDSYHEWRYKPLPDFFVRKYNFTHVHSECRTCRWASAKLNGLKWDAEQQAVSYPRVVHAGTRETKAKTSDYILYKDVDQIGFDIDGEPTVSAREFCSKRRDCKAYNHMGWAKSSVSNVQRKRGVYLYVKREHALSLIPSPSVGPLTNVNCDFEMDEAVDIVYSWVNWTAPSYISQMRNEGLLYGDESESHMNYEKPADDSAYEELRYSIASLLKYGSTNSIHKIYVVINPVHGPPSWLNTSHPKIEIVHHSKILPKVPTNNAWAISTALHRIPGLGKWFLALNDDVILNRKLKLDRLTIGCPRSELAHTHCPTLRNTCLMHALEDQFGERVGKVYEHRRKSTLKYRPDIVLWLEHHNWLVENGHATFEPNSNWFGLVNTNEWRKDSEWVYRRWDQVLKKAENSMWINFQGPGISWEYPENQAIRRQFHSWISGQGFTKHFDAMRDTPVNPREITSVKIFASSTSSGTVIKTVNSNNINEVAKECAEHPNCEAFERMRPGNYRLMSGTGMVSGSHDVFVMREEPSCSHSVSPDLDLLIPSSGRHILCDTLKSIECHSSYLSHCPNGPNVFIYGARAISCDNVQAKCIRYLEKAPPLEIKRGIATERQLQTSDFISLLNAVTGQGSVMLMDDDFLWCSEYVEYIQSAFENQFPIAFLGQGSNGMLMNKADARGLAAYLTKHRASNNVDILQYRYAKSLGKCMARSEIRLSRHKGIKSSFARLENGFWVDDNFCGMPMMPKHVKNVFGVSWNQFYDKMWRTTGCKKHRRAPVSPALSEGNPVPLVESNIPKMIHMTGRGHPNREYRSWKDKNPDWDVIWYSDEQVSNYVKEKYPEYESTWRKMSKIARFDFWRILVVHREGGLYVDSDVTCNRPIAEWDIRPGDKFISGTECWGCNDIELQLIQFAFMAVPEHPVLKYAMVHIATNAWRRPSYARHYENAMKNVFHSSGPGALTHGLLQYLFSRKHDPDCVTPHGRCEDVSVLPWWWWGYMDQHSKDHAATSKPAGSGGHYFLHGFRASWTHDKINQHATTEIIKEQPPKQIEPQGKFAYLFFATSTQHACAVETMVQRLIELGSSSSVDFMCVVPNDKIRFANNRIQKIVHTETQVQNDYFKFAMLKLYGFTMYKYDRIIHMDADSYVQKNLDHLFLLPDVPLAAPVANWENEFCISGALLVIKPDRHTWQTKIQPSIASYARSGKSEMNLLNEVFEHRIGSNRILPELLILPSKYLTLSTEFTHPEPYHTKMADLWKETVVFHFSGGYGKPWAPKNVAAMNDNTRKLYELARGDKCAVLPKSHKSTSRKELATRKEKSVPIDVQEFSCEGWDESSKIQWTKNKCTSTTFDMAVHLIPDIVSSAFKKYGCWEKTIVSRVIQHLNKSPYSLFLDVGANIGTFTTSAAAQGHEVIAVEPFYLNIPVISSTICHQKYDNVHLYKVGLADTSPGQKMCIWSTNSRINNGNARMTPYFEGKKDFGSDKQKECMEVIQTFTLDELLFDIYKLTRPISAMKIDIEGFETRAFRGAKRLLSSPFKPQKIWFEYQRAATIESGVPKNEIFETLSEAGYVITDFTVSSVPLTAPMWGNIHTGDLEATLVPVHDDAVSRKEKSVPNEPRIAVVVPTYNRKGYVKLCAKALSKTIDHNDIYVFDDHSDQFSTDDLQSWFGTTNVRQNEKRLKPDKQARSIVEWFVDTEYDWLVTLDSDLIVRPDWLSVLKSHLHLTEGVISLYHSSNVANHRTIGCENGICEMKSLGNAGVVWSRGLASKMLQTVSDGGGFDWGWSDWLRKNDVTQYAFEKSLVLHVGMHGTWGADSRREKSKGFDVSILSEPVQALAKLYLKGLHPDKENKYTRGVTPKFRIQRLNKG